MAKPTINDVARLAGVSKKTVSRVINQSPLLNEATRAKVEKVIAEIGYAPDPQARALALRRNAASAAIPAEAAAFARETAEEQPANGPHSGRTPPHSSRNLLALIYDDAATAPLGELQRGILSALADTGFALVVHALDGDRADDLAGFLRQHRPAGILLLPPLSDAPALVDLCRQHGCEPQCLGAEPLGEATGRILSEDREAAAQAIAYLIALGHERIGMVTGPEDSRVAQQRELGYLDAMADHDLDRGPALIATGDNSFESGLAAGQLLLEVSPRPTAIFAASDDMAAGVLHAAAQKGIKVPEALSVVGFEDAPIAARMYPPLTTVRVPFAAMARAAALQLVDPAGAASRPSRFTPLLVERASTGKVSG